MAANIIIIIAVTAVYFFVGRRDTRKGIVLLRVFLLTLLLSYLTGRFYLTGEILASVLCLFLLVFILFEGVKGFRRSVAVQETNDSEEPAQS